MPGTRMDIPFTVQDYHAGYDLHLKCLQEFDEAMKEFGVLKGICARIAEDGQWVFGSYSSTFTDCLVSIHSRAGALAMQPQNAVSVQIIAVAIKEHQEGSTTDDESE